MIDKHYMYFLALEIIGWVIANRGKKGKIILLKLALLFGIYPWCKNIFPLG